MGDFLDGVEAYEGEPGGSWGQGLTASQEEAADMEAALQADEFKPTCGLCREEIADETDVYKHHEEFFHKADCFGSLLWFTRWAQRMGFSSLCNDFKLFHKDVYNVLLVDLIASCGDVNVGSDMARRGKVERAMAQEIVQQINRIMKEDRNRLDVALAPVYEKIQQKGMMKNSRGSFSKLRFLNGWILLPNLFGFLQNIFVENLVFEGHVTMLGGVMRTHEESNTFALGPRAFVSWLYHQGQYSIEEAEEAWTVNTTINGGGRVEGSYGMVKCCVDVDGRPAPQTQIRGFRRGYAFEASGGVDGRLPGASASAFVSRGGGGTSMGASASMGQQALDGRREPAFDLPRREVRPRLGSYDAGGARTSPGLGAAQLGRPAPRGAMPARPAEPRGLGGLTGDAPLAGGRPPALRWLERAPDTRPAAPSLHLALASPGPERRPQVQFATVTPDHGVGANAEAESVTTARPKALAAEALADSGAPAPAKDLGKDKTQEKQTFWVVRSHAHQQLKRLCDTGIVSYQLFDKYILEIKKETELGPVQIASLVDDGTLQELDAVRKVIDDINSWRPTVANVKEDTPLIQSLV